MKTEKMLQNVFAQEMLISERFKKTAESFQTTIRLLASNNKKETLQVYIWWREYCQDCQNYDQSPVFSEFETWYQEKLNA